MIFLTPLSAGVLEAAGKAALAAAVRGLQLYLAQRRYKPATMRSSTGRRWLSDVVRRLSKVVLPTPLAAVVLEAAGKAALAASVRGPQLYLAQRCFQSAACETTKPATLRSSTGRRWLSEVARRRSKVTLLTPLFAGVFEAAGKAALAASVHGLQL